MQAAEKIINMKVSELMNLLNQHLQTVGDSEILVEERGCGGYAMHTISGVGKSTLYSGDLEENDDEDIITELFPDWKEGDDLRMEYFEINLGTMLYAT